MQKDRTGILLAQSGFYETIENPFNAGTQRGYVKLEVTKDTIIQSKTCKVVTQERYFFNGDIWYENNILLYNENEKVYFIFDDYFYLLYDFSAFVGDSVTTYYLDEYWNDTTQSMMLRVDSMIYRVDSISFNSYNNNTYEIQNISMFILDSPYYYHIHNIFKIGNLEFLFPQNEINCDVGLCAHLRCFYNDSIFFQLNNYACDTLMLITSVSNQKKDSNNIEIEIYPNELKIVNYTQHIYRINLELYNMTGKSIYSKNINLINETQIDLHSLKKGMYFININSEEFVINQKFVKL